MEKKQAVVEVPPEEMQLHKVFLNLSLENDLTPEEMEWFKSRIAVDTVQEEQQDKKQVTEPKKTEILVEYELGRQPEKPNTFYLKLSETNTIWLFSLQPSLSENNIEDGEKVRKENETYQMKKTKKEIIRKKCMADTQTPCLIEKSKGTLTVDINMVDKYVFASEWDLHDTYRAVEENAFASSKNFLVCVGTNKSLQSSPPEVVFDQSFMGEDHVKKVFESSNFRHASLTMERLLASNCYQSKQSVFKKDIITRYYVGPTLFSYKMEPLWSFQKDMKYPLMVTDLDWNPLNQDLLAVGYGDLKFKKRSSGLICVWSPKNPRQPERQFKFNEAVTSLHYSRVKPNVLAVGTRGGNVYVLDVSSEVGSVRNLRSENWNPHPGPIWKVEWFLHKELTTETEELLAIGESGILLLFSMSMDKETVEILKLNYVIPLKKIIDKRTMQRMARYGPIRDEIYERKIFSGLSFSLFFDRKFCYIATKEGVVVKCNLRNPSMTDGIFLGHDGPIYIIQHSLVTDMVYFTCGADWSIKIWMEGIYEPLITLQHKMPVVCARWSPTIPTIIASIGEKEVSLWDIARNILTPMSVKNFDECKMSFSTLMFTTNGMNIVFGSQDGLVHVVHLSELPRIPFLQTEALIGAIERALTNNHQLLAKFTRTVEKNREKLKTEIKVSPTTIIQTDR